MLFFLFLNFLFLFNGYYALTTITLEGGNGNEEDYAYKGFYHYEYSVSQKANPVKLELYYESYCPGCRDFLTNHLYPVWKTLQKTGTCIISLLYIINRGTQSIPAPFRALRD